MDMDQLKESPFIEKIGPRGITYTQEFKEIVVREVENGLNFHEIQVKYGLEAIKSTSFNQAMNRLLKKNHSSEAIQKKKDEAKRMEQLLHENELLRIENEFLKKNLLINRGKAWKLPPKNSNSSN